MRHSGVIQRFASCCPTMWVEQVFCSARHTETFVLLAHYLGYVFLKFCFFECPKGLIFPTSGKDTTDYE